MARLSCHFSSTILDIGTTILILLPEDIKENEKLKVLYLLSGYSGDHTDWTRLTAIERYIQKYRIAVVMPDGNNSYYTDMVYGLKYFSFIAKELPDFVVRMFPISTKKEDHYIAGLSMGGYGALKVAFSFPNQYQKVASLSGALDIEHIRSLSQERGRKSQFIATFGENSTQNTNNDLKYLFSQMSKKEQEEMSLFIGCGKDDFLYQDNLNFISFLKQQKAKFTFAESSGSHDWSFWDDYIQKVLKWMFD